MIQSHLHAAAVAGLDALKRTIMTEHSRVIERTEIKLDGVTYIKLCEIKDATPHLLCIAPAEEATLYLAGKLEALQ